MLVPAADFRRMGQRDRHRGARASGCLDDFWLWPLFRSPAVFLGIFNNSRPPAALSDQSPILPRPLARARGLMLLAIIGDGQNRQGSAHPVLVPSWHQYARRVGMRYLDFKGWPPVKSASRASRTQK